MASDNGREQRKFLLPGKRKLWSDRTGLEKQKAAAEAAAFIAFCTKPRARSGNGASLSATYLMDQSPTP